MSAPIRNLALLLLLFGVLTPAAARAQNYASYIPLGPGHSASSRMGNAFSSIVMGRMDSGRKMVNVPLLAGTVGAAFIAKELYYPKLGVPELESNRVLAKAIGFNFAADGLLNLFGEFFIRKGF